MTSFICPRSKGIFAKLILRFGVMRMENEDLASFCKAYQWLEIDETEVAFGIGVGTRVSWSSKFRRIFGPVHFCQSAR